MSALKWRYKGEPATNYRGQSNINNALHPIFSMLLGLSDFFAKADITVRFRYSAFLGETGNDPRINLSVF